VGSRSSGPDGYARDGDLGDDGRDRLREVEDTCPVPRARRPVDPEELI